MREMKDSGVEWIGVIPKKWDVRKLNDVACKITDYVASGSFADLNKNVEYLDEPDYAMLVRTADLSGTRDKRVFINQHAYEFLSNSNLFGGEIILSNIGSVGNVYLFSPMYKRCSLAPNSIMIDGCPDNRYVYYWFQNPLVNDELKRIGGNAVQLKFNKTQLRQFKVLCPPLGEQRKIADYLDYKCALIDSIIVKQEAIIEKLKEYKLSIITEAVTKGLNPDVEMKDTDSEWIRRIPSHAKITRCGHLYDIILGKMLTPNKTKDDETLEKYYCAANVHFDGVNDTELKTMWFSSRDREVYKVKNGDLLVVEGGAGAGGAALVENSQNNCYIQNSILIARSKHDCLLNRWLYYMLYSLVKRGYIDLVCNKATIPHFTKEKLCDVPIVVFSKQENCQIIAYLDRACSYIDTTIQNKSNVIDKLKEYKKSIIYEVVTGKKEV